jgi:DNA replication regulator DPB11
MGAHCFFDLTVQVTHLIIGDVSTAKYSYVAKERPDINVLMPEFVEAVRTAWMAGDEVDIHVLERKHRAPTFFGLQICLTGYSNREYWLPSREQRG